MASGVVCQTVPAYRVVMTLAVSLWIITGGIQGKALVLTAKGLVMKGERFNPLVLFTPQFCC